LEELFITSDIGVNTTTKIIEEVKNEVKRDVLKNPDELKNAIKKKLLDILSIENELKKALKKIKKANGNKKKIRGILKDYKKIGLDDHRPAPSPYR